MYMSLDDLFVSEIMVKDVQIVGESVSLQEACKVMSSRDIGSVVIVTNVDSKENRIPIGIITEHDVAKQIGIDPYRSHFSVPELLTNRTLITIPATTSLRYALRLMVSENIRRLPVVENSRLVGIVTDKDIYRAIVKNESLIASLMGDEFLAAHVKVQEQPWVYKLGEILHRRLGSDGAGHAKSWRER
jgi:CBS domain-containing protein